MCQEHQQLDYSQTVHTGAFADTHNSDGLLH